MSEEQKQADKSANAGTDKTDNSWSSEKIEQLTSGAAYIKRELEKRGKSQLKSILEEADNISERPLAIAVIGNSGQGKSLLINTLRDLRPDDEGWVPVGETETTIGCRGHKHPTYPNLVFWDIPGVGTKNFPKANYLSAIHFDRYDFYLICSSSRFTENDIWLLQIVKEHKKKCYFLRTKIDIDIYNAQRIKAVSKFDKMKEIREYCRENLSDEKVFLISCFEKNEYDFPLFLQTLLADAPKEQSRLLTLGLVSVSVEMIEQKAMFLKSEIWKTAFISAAGGAIPIIGFSFGVDSVVISGKIKEYQRHFELTNAHIKGYAESIGLSITEFRKIAELKVDFDLIEKEGIVYLVKKVGVQKIGGELLRYVPIIGTTIAAGLSYKVTGDILDQILDDCKHDAIAAFKLVTTRKSKI